MTVYLICLALILFLYEVEVLRKKWTTHDTDIVFSSAQTRQHLILIGIFLIILISFRSVQVGKDTLKYLRAFLERDYISRIRNTRDWWLGEVGFRLLALLLRTLGLPFQSLLIIEGLIYIIPVIFIILRYSRNPYYSAFLFIALDYYLFAMTGLRQTLALGLVAIAYFLAEKRKLLPCCLQEVRGAVSAY